jgi:DNA-binding transcriptional LysR family regulator
MLDVRRLRVLLAVREQGGVAAAARALTFTPPAVSQQIAALEREVGTTLLDRSSRPARLTAAGERLADHAGTVLAGLEAAAADVAALADGSPTGVLRIGVIPTVGRAVLPTVVRRLVASAPALRLHVEQLEPEDSLPALARGDLDVAVASEFALTPRRRDHRTERVDLAVESLLVAVPATHPQPGPSVALEALRDESWLAALPGSSCRIMLQRACAAAGFEPVECGHCSEFDMMLALVGAGLGVALVPAISVPVPPPSDVRILTVDGDRVARTLFASVRRGTAGHPGIRATLAALREAASEVVSGPVRRHDLSR